MPRWMPISRFADVRDERGHRLVVRDGYHQPREVLTSAGAMEVTAPRVNDKGTDPDTGVRCRFSSAILPAWSRKTPKITEVLPLSAWARWRAVNAPHLVALVRAGARFENGSLVARSEPAAAGAPRSTQKS
jgi:hypothetical protein